MWQKDTKISPSLLTKAKLDSMIQRGSQRYMKIESPNSRDLPTGSQETLDQVKAPRGEGTIPGQELGPGEVRKKAL